MRPAHALVQAQARQHYAAPSSSPVRRWVQIQRLRLQSQPQRVVGHALLLACAWHELGVQALPQQVVRPHAALLQEVVRVVRVVQAQAQAQAQAQGLALAAAQEERRRLHCALWPQYRCF